MTGDTVSRDRSFYGVATGSVPVCAVLVAFTFLALLSGSLLWVWALWLPGLLLAAALVVRYRWRAVAGLSVGLLVGFATAYLALIVASDRSFR